MPSAGVTIGAGRWRGTRLVNQNPQCHPMGAREKNALFNRLASDLPRARVLDLFAGTGALGLEAASRGAASVLMVDRDRSNLVDNLTTVLERAEREPDAPALAYAPVRIGDFLTSAEKAALRFDIILADPPYAQFEQFAPDLVRAASLLTPGGVMVISQPAGTPLLTLPGLEQESAHTYAGAELVQYRKSSN